MMAQHKKFKKPEGPQGTRVEVRDNDIKHAMRRLKKLMITEGVFKEMRDRRFFEKPSTTRKKAKAAARKRHLKELARRQD